jgi:AcrR family transcriptional regulator
VIAEVKEYEGHRPLRADARLNRNRIVIAAKEAFSTDGPHVTLDEIAQRAKLSPATLYRHFAGRDELMAEVVELRFSEEVEPVIAAAIAAVDADPWQGLVDVVGASLYGGLIGPAWSEVLTVAREAGLVLELARERFLIPVAELLHRAQAAGVVRPEIESSDLAPIIRMLRALMITNEELTDTTWLRYLSLLLRTHQATT